MFHGFWESRLVILHLSHWATQHKKLEKMMSWSKNLQVGHSSKYRIVSKMFWKRKIDYLHQRFCHWLSKIETSTKDKSERKHINHQRITMSAKGCVILTKFLRCFTEYIHVNRSKILDKLASFHWKFLQNKLSLGFPQFSMGSFVLPWKYSAKINE